jgi:Zn-dependent peptidase ImmA (M78 family)
LAHELGHILLDTGDHVNDATNLMTDTLPDNEADTLKLKLTKEQCETARQKIPGLFN